MGQEVAANGGWSAAHSNSNESMGECPIPAFFAGVRIFPSS